MKKYLIILITITLLSCNNETKEKPALTPKEFENMLFDIHLADGILSAENIYRTGKLYRPSYYYNSIFEKYNITSEKWDSCVDYYSQNTIAYTQMYDKVIDSLNRLETQYRIKIKEAELEQDTINLWTQKTAWKIPQDGCPNLTFAIPVSKKGIYTITATIKRYPNDQNIDPRIEAYFWKKDSLGNVKKVEFSPAPIVRDSIFRTYTIQLEYPDSTYTYLRGNLFSTNNKFVDFTEHYEIKNIKIYNPEMKVDTTKIAVDSSKLKKHKVTIKTNNIVLEEAPETK